MRGKQAHKRACTKDFLQWEEMREMFHESRLPTICYLQSASVVYLGKMESLAYED